MICKKCGCALPSQGYMCKQCGTLMDQEQINEQRKNQNNNNAANVNLMSLENNPDNTHYEKNEKEPNKFLGAIIILVIVIIIVGIALAKFLL